MTVEERIEQTKKWFAELKSIESDMKCANEWRDAAFDMNDFVEYHNAVIKLLKLEKESILIRRRLAECWYNVDIERRWKSIVAELEARNRKW